MYLRSCFLITILLFSCQKKNQRSYDIIIRNGTLYNGSGSEPFIADVAVHGDTIAFIGDLRSARGTKEIDATGLAVCPGFINMLSWADRSLLMDGHSMSDIKQGVTLEVFGEGWSPGPVRRDSGTTHDSLWTTLDGYLRWLTKKGVSPNVGSFVGHTTVRQYVMGYENRKPNEDELEQMKRLVREAMEEGAFGLGSSLIYAPANFADTEELIELAKVAAEYDGLYITHMRSESDFIFSALHETFRIAKEASIRTEIYHLKINHARNWSKLDSVIYKIDSANKAGLTITANMYPYAASNTSLVARLPTWVQEGGAKEMRKKLRQPAIRKKVLYEMREGIPSRNSNPEDVMILGFKNDSLNALYRGKRLHEVAIIHGKDADETLIDLLMKDKSPGAGVYFLMSEKNVERILQLPFVSFGSDGASLGKVKTFADWGTHPRAYGTFARVLGKYIRDEKLLTLPQAIHRMTYLPASRLTIHKRGLLAHGYFADLVIFDPSTIQDHATYDNPHEYATGVHHVFVNGVQVLDNGVHTGVFPGRVIKRASKRQ
jgi:N-acyl-D-amino-acid deacylase